MAASQVGLFHDYVPMAQPLQSTGAEAVRSKGWGRGFLEATTEHPPAVEAGRR